MKKKLLIALALSTLIFAASGLFIFRTLNGIIEYQKVKDDHEDISDYYRAILLNVESAEAEVYRNLAGHHRAPDDALGYIQRTQELLSRVKTTYAPYRGSAVCSSCHTAQGGLDTLDTTFRELTRLSDEYGKKIGALFTLKVRSVSMETAAAADKDAIIAIVKSLLKGADRMEKDMEQSLKASERNARRSIIIAVLVSIALLSGVIILAMRSVTGPVNQLATAIRTVSGGNYDAKVVIAANDEIGFLAKTFNAMTEDLGKMTAQKEELLRDLRELNASLEQRVHEATEQLRIAHEEMLRKETLSMIGTFAAGVAHELATPFSTIISYAQMMRDRLPDNPELREDFDIVEGELKRCRTVLRGILDFARAPQTDRAPVDLNALILALLSLIRFQKEYAHISLKETLDAGIPHIMAVPGQLQQVIMNIVVNGLEAMPGGGELSVATFMADGARGKRAVVRITDTGIGIPEEEIKNIFKPYYTKKQSGTGLGLAISHGIVREHGGEIKVASVEGQGTTFEIYLPINEESR